MSSLPLMIFLTSHIHSLFSLPLKSRQPTFIAYSSLSNRSTWFHVIFDFYFVDCNCGFDLWLILKAFFPFCSLCWPISFIVQQEVQSVNPCSSLLQTLGLQAPASLIYRIVWCSNVIPFRRLGGFSSQRDCLHRTF